MEKTLRLPSELTRKNSVLALAGCVYALALWILPGLAVGAIWSSALSPALKILLPWPLALIGGYGVLLCGFMGHDGTHFNLHENRRVSSILGILFTAPTVFYLLMGFTISHWNHHKYTNTVDDPDSRLFSRFRSFWTRFLFARFYTFYEYGLNCVRLALGRPLPFKYNFPLGDREVRNLARLNLAANLFFAAVHVVCFLQIPVYWAGIFFVRFFGALVSGLSPYIEHTGTGIGRGQDTRTSVGRWWDIFLVGNNYHLEHHLYPTLPFYRLKRAHAFLVNEGYYQTPRHVSHGVLGTYRYTLGTAPYPMMDSTPT